MFCSLALSLFTRAPRLLERRARYHRRFGSKRRRITSGRDGGPAIDRRLARTRLSRIRNSRNELWRMDRRIARQRRKRFAFCRAHGADRECRTRDLAQSRLGLHAAQIATGEHRRRSWSRGIIISARRFIPIQYAILSRVLFVSGEFDLIARPDGHRSDPQKMAWLGIIARATRPFRLSHDA